MSDCRCAMSSLHFIRTGRYYRDGEALVLPVEATGVCLDCGENADVKFTVRVPCAEARRGNNAAREYLGNRLAEQLTDTPFGPISYQRFVEAAMDKTAVTDMKTLAGEPFLLLTPTQGRA